MWKKQQEKTIAIALIILTILVIIQAKSLGLPEQDEPDDSPTIGQTITVDISGEGFFRSIQRAINWAKNGDIIVVKKGVYREHIVVDKSITLKGKDRNATIIDGSASGDVVTINADRVTISDLTIRNSGKNYDQGIRVNGNKCIIKDSCITTNYRGILCYSTSHTSVLRNDFVLNEGTGIKISESDDTIISSNQFYQNGEGIRISDSKRTIISTNVLTEHNGLDIEISQSSNTTIMGNTIIEDRIGGIRIFHSMNLIFFQNHLESTDYGLQMYDTTSAVISENHIKNTRFDAILLYGSSEIMISKNIILESRDQGIILINSSDNTVIDNTIDRCYGFGLTLGTSSSDNIIHDNRIINNTKGLCIDHSVNNTIKDNFFESQGITFKGSLPDHYTSHTIENNIIHDKMINCYTRKKKILFPSSRR
jgi:nitrous oxidase accessory protein